MDIGSMIIIGAVVSLIVQGIKKWFGTSQWQTLAAVIIVSLVGGFIWWGSQYQVAYWNGFVQILAAAGAVYTFIIKRFETESK